MTYILETERLRLREFSIDDADFVLQLLNTPGWLEFIGDRNVKTKSQAIEYLKNGPMKSYEQYNYGLSMIERKHDGRVVGACGLLKRENLDGPDIGYALLPEFGGYGYAYEIAHGVRNYAFETLFLPKIYGICKLQNARSIRLLEKLGLTFTGFYSFPDSPEKSLLYTLEGVDWQEAPPNIPCPS